jgi:hypothetical protein
VTSRDDDDEFNDEYVSDNDGPWYDVDDEKENGEYEDDIGDDELDEPRHPAQVLQVFKREVG